MNRIYSIRYAILMIVGIVALHLSSCKSDHEAPTIESVWTNSASAPAEQVNFSYPGETICLHGHDFSDLQQVSVNGQAIDLMKTIMYDTDSFITFAIPMDAPTTKECGLSHIKVITAHGEASYEHFLLKPTSEKPKINSVSTKSLIPGSTLEIKGVNLDGVTEVYLPLVFDQCVKCELDANRESTATSVFVVIPENVNFATGKIKMVLSKRSEELNCEYTENVYSAKMDFSNK